ncbi:hypothetical protein EC991_006430 [Linnemannia zychae]|nr:hypothetical protein EC991_006430 [Linnemannia zychae]
MSVNDSFVIIGTPLPQPKKQSPYDDTNKRPNPAKDLEVKDEHGRRRFHGAFTGGFSAGYYNTVGSAEGLAQELYTLPSMLSDATRITATDDFGSTGSAQRDLARKSAAAMSMRASGSILGALPDNMIDDLIIPASESIGVRLLKRMGWKPGQGIGPRVSRRQRHPTDDTLSDDDTPGDITFAPVDSAVILFNNKSNHFGLGFDPHKDAPEFDISANSNLESRYLAAADFKATGTTVGFGMMGDSDDEDDVYGSGSNHLHLAEREVDISATSNKRRKRSSSNAHSNSKATSSSAYCSDGRPPLAGFILITTKSQEPKWYSAPDVPADFIPRHTFSSNGKITAPVKQHGQSKLTADDRALALGETPIDAPRRSVFEYISSENKHRLDGMLGFVLDVEGEKHMRKDHWEVPKIEKSAAEAALQGFMPFSDNIAKQQRYKQYLNVQAGLSDEKIEQVEGFSGENMTKELNEFVQAARIFKPLSTSMSSRFTSASTIVEIKQPAPGLRTAADILSTPAEKAAPAQRTVQRLEVPKSQAAKAAEMGMFGPLTRSMVDFYPNKLLCKRFNVPDPHPEHKETGPEPAKDLLDKATMDSMMMQGAPTGSLLSMASTNVGGEIQPMTDLADEGLGVETEQAQAEPIQERPPMDIFKAIFDDSDSDSDSDNDLHPPSEAAGQEQSESTIKADAQEVEADNEGATTVPFRPIFTRRANKPARSPSPASTVPHRPSKFGTQRVDSRVRENELDEESDDDQIGPRLDFSRRRTTTGRQKARGSSPIDTGTRHDLTKDQKDTPEHSILSSTSYNRDSDSEDFIGPPAPPSLAKEFTPPVVDKQARDGERGKDTENHEQEIRRESRSSKRQESSSSRMDEDERSRSRRSHSERTSRSHRRSPSAERSSKSRHRREKLEGYESDASSGDNDRYTASRSGEPSSKRTRVADESHSDRGKKDERSTKHHKDYRSRPSDKRRYSDHERDHSRSSKSSRHHKHSRSEKHSSRHTSHDRDRERKRTRDRSSDRHSRAHDYEDGDDGVWVEKESDSVSTAMEPEVTDIAEPTQAALSARNRPRAAAFF